MDNNTPKNRPSIMEVLSRDPENKENTLKQSSKKFTPIINVSSTPVEQPQKEIIKERVVVEYRDKDRGCSNIGCGCGCRTLGCGCFIFIALIIAGLAYILINKPPFIWSEVVSFMNDGVEAPKYKQQDLSTLQDSINSQISNIGEVKIDLTQDQVTTLIRDKAPQLKDLTVEVITNQFTIYWYLDNTLPAKPMYGIVNINSKDDGTLEISRIGTGKVALPDFINKTATNGIYSLLNINTNDSNQTPLSILTSLFNSKNISVKSVELKQGIIEITADINVNLFQQ